MREVWLLGASVAVYAAIPLIIVSTRLTTRFILLYAYIAAVLVLGGLLGSVYAFPISDDVALLAGQVAYGALMFATLVTVVESRDLQAVRTIVTLVVTVNVVVFALFRISEYALNHGEVINPLEIDPALFSGSIRILLSGGILIVGELMLLLGILEKTKRRIGPRGMLGVYPLAFVGILALDGVLFPVLAFFPFDGLGSVIASGVQAKLTLAGVYTLPLMLFLVLRRSALSEYHATPIHLRHLLSGDTLSALAQIERQEQQISEQRQRLRATTPRPGSARPGPRHRCSLHPRHSPCTGVPDPVWRNGAPLLQHHEGLRPGGTSVGLRRDGRGHHRATARPRGDRAGSAP